MNNVEINLNNRDLFGLGYYSAHQVTHSELTTNTLRSNCRENYRYMATTSSVAVILMIISFSFSADADDGGEGEALLSTGWWNSTTSSSSPYCNWLGIRCNKAGTVTQICLPDSGLNGGIPHQIAALAALVLLDLSSNNLTGKLPPSLANLTQLEYLVLHSNTLHGSIPPGIGNLLNLSFLDVRKNQLSGLIPVEIGNLKKLSYLDMSENLITGKIPSQLGHLKLITYLNLSHNNLAGPIPSCLSSYMSSTIKIDLSHNNQLESSIPFEYQSSAPPEAFSPTQETSDYHDEGLFGESKGRWPRSKKRHQFILIIVVSLSATLLLLVAVVGFLFLRQRIRKNQSVETTTLKNGDLFSIWNYDGVIAYQDIICATEDFDIKYCIGHGSYGSVYRAQLPSGKVVALKKLHASERENLNYLKSFENEVQMLSTIRHRNIVKLHGFCRHKRCMFLVYNYMERGSLFRMLRDDAKAVELHWIKRVNVVKGIALSYMHHDCSFPIIHGDISSNNILLNSTLEASVSDFDTGRLLDPDSSNQTLIAGKLNYINIFLFRLSSINDISKFF